MKGVTEIKSVGDIRTATSHHIASKPPQKGTTYLDLYLLDREKQRLEKGLSRLEVQKKRIHERLGEIQRAIEKLDEAAQREHAARRSSAKPTADQQVASSQQLGRRRWKKMTLDY